MARRVPALTRDDVAEEHRAAYDEVTDIRGQAPVIGPSSVMIYSPEMAVLANRLSEHIRTQSTLSEKNKELAGMIGARSMDCQYIWVAQAAASRRAGISDALVDALLERVKLPAMAPEEAAVVNYALELTDTNHVSQETFDAALNELGARGLTEFTTYMGYFRLMAMNVNAFTIDLPEHIAEPLLPS